MGIALPGLATGMDTAGLINSLMRIEATPQTLLKNKVSASQNMVSSLQALNAKIASLAELSKATAKTGALNLFVATSSSTAVTAKAGPGASAGSVDFVVDRLAQAHAGVSAAMTAWPTAPPVLTFVASNGTRTEVTAASTSLDDVVSAVNGSAAGVTAMKVSTGDGKFRLQLTASTSGAAGSFTAYRGSGANIDAGTAVDLFTEPGAAVIKTGQDAQVTLWAGTAAAQAVTSSSNTFTGLLPGVDVTVAAVSATPVTVTVARDKEQVTKKAEELVTALNGVFAFIKTNSAVTSGSNGSTKGGIFTGDSTVRDAGQRLLSAASRPVSGRSPSEIGITITRDGNFTFDAVKFEAALAAEPAFVQSALQEMAGRVTAAATISSDKYTGLVTSKITGQEALVKNLNDQILKWDDRLAARRSTLERVYSGLEVQISRMNSQSAWLASQLATLPQGNTQP
jgi:flagellar hook-associated protein 2